MECWNLKTWLGLLVVLLATCTALAFCPLACSCFRSSRHVDCSDRNLTTLPHGLQDNITHLNLSHNHFLNLDHQLTRFTNLRTLDLSNNRLRSIPVHLPKSLWELRATNNNIRVLQKQDTAQQWNLKLLDISQNRIERAVLINNTLSSLKLLNMSSNHLWTIPTNMPYKVETVDLSHNSLTQILPATLARLSSLAHLYLHNNRFTHIPNGSFDHLPQLKQITLQQNPWACNEKEQITYLLNWTMETSAFVMGYLCPNQTLSSWDIAQLTPAPTKGMHLLTDRGQAGVTTENSSLGNETTRQTQMYKQIQDITPSEASTFLISTENTWLEDQGSATESNFFVEMAEEPDLVKDSIVINLSSNIEKQASTIITSKTANGNPTKLPDKTPQSTTMTLVKNKPTTNVLNSHTRSLASGSQHFLSILFMHVLVLLIS
ncbi:oligodendrocyte-myelin glycoprotein [Ambystoma mexicanum]|uniref:oligodendrocyte-myelin glycoprotein n=1 Tax=Ambystoma mexicanum TaxID=8296 RepID=UPI0037E946FA